MEDTRKKKQRINSRFLEQWIPPALMNVLRGLRGITWSGNYASWAEAQKVSTGYDQKAILESVKDSLLKVKNGEAAYERDGVLFDEIQYSWPLLAILIWITTQSNGKLNLVDFGGSLGSTYFHHRLFLDSLPKLFWNIIEQKHFVDAGKKYFENESLKFFYDIESCLRTSSPNTILLSSVIQYLEKPYELLRKIKSMGFEFIVFDRTPFAKGGKERLTVQKIPASIYKASYPCWFFDKRKFLAILNDKYELIAKYDALDKANIPSTFEGYLFRSK